MSARRLVALACACLLAFNAAAARKEPLPAPVGQQLPVEVEVAGSELAVEVNTKAIYVTGVALGGVVGGLIANEIAGSRVERAQERAAPMRAALQGYDFDARAVMFLQKGLPSAGLSPAPVVTRVQAPWQVLRGDAARALPPRAMVVRPRYSIDAEFTTLTVTLDVEIVDRVVKSSGKPKGEVLFARTYTFGSRIDNVDPEQNLQQWLALGGADMRVLLDHGLQQVIAMIEFDFSPGGRAQWDMGPPSRPARIGDQLVKGVMVVHEADTFVWTRSGFQWANFDGAQRIDVQAYLAARAARERQRASAPAAEPAAGPAAGSSDAAGAASSQGAP